MNTGRNQQLSRLGLYLLGCLFVTKWLQGVHVSALSSTATSSATATCRSAATTTTTTTQLSAASESKTEGRLDVSMSVFSPAAWMRSNKPRSKCGPCPDDEDNSEAEDVLEALFHEHDEDSPSPSSSSLSPGSRDKDMDRREAAFAMLGTLWASTTAITAFPNPSRAVYGAEPKIELPNVVENMANRANKQCLVESLGNRECLVYMDPDNQLYQGADSQKLLQKIDMSSASLIKIPELVEAKKWSGVKSIITGPMGELLVTMNTLAPLSTKEPDRSVALAKQVKLQIFAIAAAVDKKDGTNILKSHQAATDALVAFVQSL